MRLPLIGALAVGPTLQTVTPTSVFTGSPEAFIAHLKVSGFAGAGNIIVKIQHSPDPEATLDASATWYDLVTFTTATGNTTEAKTAATPRFGRVRLSIQTTGTNPAANVDVVIEGETNWSNTK